MHLFGRDENAPLPSVGGRIGSGGGWHPEALETPCQRGQDGRCTFQPPYPHPGQEDGRRWFMFEVTKKMQ
jgi:hypothetical protein